jgi:hypothetical protein
LMEVELGFVSEGLEAVDEKGLEVHGEAGKGDVWGVNHRARDDGNLKR